MLETNKLEFLETLLSTPSPVGYETAGQLVWLNYVKGVADRIHTDAYGSAAAIIETGKDRPLLMLEAHCDEIGMVIQHVDEKGFIYINRLGGSDPGIARARKVSIHAQKGVVRGIIGHTAIHLQNRDGNAKAPSWKDLFVDIGASSREEALEMVRIGDPVTYSDDVEFLSDEIFTARAVDNRIGGFIIAEAFLKLAEIRDELEINVAIVNSVQEEIGGFGARMMSYTLAPNVALVTDVTHATDSPGIDHKEHGRIILGEGAAITHGTANQRKVVERLVHLAELNQIPVQHEASGVRTGTDTDSIFHSRSGIPSALISTPLRYMHSPVEMASLKDVQAVADLMVAFAKSMSADDTFSLFG
ncbi:MAG: M20/M25/M40 family metallo-hydrolase [Balneolales bacterium]|nr:M20/M25/M40 family metallo-hydrolase [Balneolales bacterium]